jgi:hypothetical protein
MTEETLQKESQSLTRALPIYLAVQGTTLLMTFLDSPVYMEAYQANHLFTVNGWVGAWFVLVIFGLTTAVFLLVRKTWRLLVSERTRMKLVVGYFLGGFVGMLTLGFRFMPVMTPQYFVLVAALMLLLGGAYLVWKKRLHTAEEMFP